MTSDDDMSSTETLELLQHALAALPDDTRLPHEDPPEAVVEGALWVHQWLHMDAELAELTFDSKQSPELAGVRSGGPLRDLTFVSGEYTIELEIEPSPRAVQVSGFVEPAVDGVVKLVVSGEVFSADLDARGAFLLENVPHGTVLAFADLPGSTVRLGSFEV